MSDAIHHVVQEWNVIITIEYAFLDVQGMTNVEMENNARMEYVFRLEVETL